MNVSSLGNVDYNFIVVFVSVLLPFICCNIGSIYLYNDDGDSELIHCSCMMLTLLDMSMFMVESMATLE